MLELGCVLMKPYYMDEHATIYHGDCWDILPYLNVGLLCTDPPYGIKAVRPDGKTGGSVAAPNRKYRPVQGDDAPLDPTPLLVGRRQIIWGADHFVAHPGRGRFLVWDKRDGVASNDFADCEIAWDSRGGPNRVHRHRQMGMIHDGLGDIGRVHPTQKPLSVMSWCLSLDDADDVVVDPFMGSGTTLRAAKDRGRYAIGVELDEAYCEMAANRLAQEVLAL
jgi:site-specific DNA-methyltransferase (adenine-specific)